MVGDVGQYTVIQPGSHCQVHPPSPFTALLLIVSQSYPSPSPFTLRLSWSTHTLSEVNAVDYLYSCLILLNFILTTKTYLSDFACTCIITHVRDDF